MKYKYFVSFVTNNNTFGESFLEVDYKLDSMQNSDKVRTEIMKLLKTDNPDVKFESISILNFILL